MRALRPVVDKKVFYYGLSLKITETNLLHDYNLVSKNNAFENAFYIVVGGSERMRPYWKKFTDQCCILVYVVDGADNLMFKEAKTAFKNLLEDVSLKDVSCLLVANKQVCYSFFDCLLLCRAAINSL